MRFTTLDSWLDWQQGLNPKTIELGLDRVQQVYQRLKLPKIATKVITVAGTNGKGSTVAYYETWLKNCGFKVASYTSPHLLEYNERIKLNLQAVSDDSLCQAFSVIDEARGDIALTYFEFGTLAALFLIAQFKPDVAILEVGLGGRLDAVNIIDADLAHITPIGMDHEDWLGNTIDAIAYEKAGILRDESLAVCNMPELPASLLAELERHSSQYSNLNRDYNIRPGVDGFYFWSNNELSVKFKPPLFGYHQAVNISGVLQGLYLLGFFDSMPETDIAKGFDNVNCPGRLQKIDTDHAFQLYVDVGHNEDAAAALAESVAELKISGKVFILLGMLEDKNSTAFVSRLKPVVDEWWVLGLNCDRGLSGADLAQGIEKSVPVDKVFNSPEQTIKQAVLSLKNQDILLVCGSFMTVQSVLTVI